MSLRYAIYAHQYVEWKRIAKRKMQFNEYLLDTNMWKAFYEDKQDQDILMELIIW